MDNVEYPAEQPQKVKIYSNEIDDLMYNKQDVGKNESLSSNSNFKPDLDRTELKFQI